MLAKPRKKKKKKKKKKIKLHIFQLDFYMQLIYVENGNWCLQNREKKSNFISSDFDMAYLNVYPHQKCKKHLCCNLFTVNVKYR